MTMQAQIARKIGLVGNRLLSRRDFGPLLNSLGLTGEAVEVGTHRGEFAALLLRTWSGKKLHCVDPWVAGYDDHDPASYGDREADMRLAEKALIKYGERCRLLRATSAEAAPEFPDAFLDFVYLDGCHQQISVARDVSLWWPKVREAGILAGDDFACPGEGQGGWGRYVQPEVLAFAERESLVVNLTCDADCRPWSWYVTRQQKENRQ